MSHAEQLGGWRSNTLMDAVAGIIPIDRALHLVGVRGSSDLAVKAKQDLTDAVTAYKAGAQDIAMATASDLAEEIRRTRQPGRRAVA